MCLKELFKKPELQLLIQPWTDRTISTNMVGDFAGTANDLAGPPNDRVDIRKAIIEKWPDYNSREFLNRTATGDRLVSEIRDAATDLAEDGMLLFIMDTCFAHSSTRNGVAAHVAGYMYHPPEISPVIPKLKSRILKDMVYPKVLVLSACLDNETAADAVFDGRANGAFHYCLIKTLKKGITYRQWFEATKRLLIALGFNQTPTLDGPEELKDRIVFEGKVRMIDVSTHGTTVPDEDGDEWDGRDEAIVMRDRLVIDDEIKKILLQVA